jgi:hypothetical protein
MIKIEDVLDVLDPEWNDFASGYSATQLVTFLRGCYAAEPAALVRLSFESERAYWSVDFFTLFFRHAFAQKDFDWWCDVMEHWDAHLDDELSFIIEEALQLA